MHRRQRVLASGLSSRTHLPVAFAAILGMPARADVPAGFKKVERKDKVERKNKEQVH